LKSEISNAKKMLAEGNVKEAQSFYNRYGLRGGGNENKTSENAAGRGRSCARAGEQSGAGAAGRSRCQQRLVGPGQPPQQQRAELNVNYDNAAPSGSVGQIAARRRRSPVAKVRPLRVNLLPAECSSAFTQVLTTENRQKP